MNIHKNARTTPRSRDQIVERVVTYWKPPANASVARSTTRLRPTSACIRRCLGEVVAALPAVLAAPHASGSGSSAAGDEQADAGLGS